MHTKTPAYLRCLAGGLSALALALLGGCATVQPACKCPSGPETSAPAAPPLQQAPWSALPDWGRDDLAAAWPALLASCTKLARQPLWARVCDEMAALPDSNVARHAWLENRFSPWQVVNADGSREGMITGYYEPLLQGSRKRSKQARHPVYGVPDDLLTIDLGAVRPDLAGQRLRGRLEGRKIVPYWSRAEIEAGRAPRERVLLWVDDPVALFFLQIQGSGRVELPDGKRVRLGYADQNGHPYRSIGRVLIERGEMTLENASMQGIQDWARANPARLRELLDENPSFVFFRELPNTGGGPIGALGVPLTPQRSLAVDRRTVPLGAPLWLATTHPTSARPLNRLMVAQDTGGAIRGPVRGDYFWGFGDEAGAEAGRMRHPGKMWVLMPRGWLPPAP